MARNQVFLKLNKQIEEIHTLLNAAKEFHLQEQVGALGVLGESDEDLKISLNIKV